GGAGPSGSTTGGLGATGDLTGGLASTGSEIPAAALGTAAAVAVAAGAGAVVAVRRRRPAAEEPRPWRRGAPAPSRGPPSAVSFRCPRRRRAPALTPCSPRCRVAALPCSPRPCLPAPECPRRGPQLSKAGRAKRATRGKPSSRALLALTEYTTVRDRSRVAATTVW